MNIVLHFTALMTKLTRLLPLVHFEKPELEDVRIDGQTTQELTTGLNGMLTELAEAFEARDSVLIGDLLEYEIPPRVEQFITFLKEAQNPS